MQTSTCATKHPPSNSSHPHTLLNNLILLPLLLKPRVKLNLEYPDPLRQNRQNSLLPQIRKPKVPQPKRHQKDLELRIQIRQLHQIRQPLRRIKQHVTRNKQRDEDSDDEWQVLRHGLAEGAADGEHDGGENILEAGDEKERGVLRIEGVGVVLVHDGGLVPGLFLDILEGDGLGGYAEYYLT